MLDISNKIITIVGAKRSGLALAKLVQELGGIARITHTQCLSELDDSTVGWIKKNNIDLENEGHSEEFLNGSDYLVLSPGVRIDSDIVKKANQLNIPVLGEIEFAYQFCDKPVIGVTGSNGKTTVVTLISQMLEASGLKACLCGNVGQPFSQYCRNLNDKDYVVLELSSFQLESMMDSSHPMIQKGELKGFKPYIAILLNFSQNHLDRHKDLDDYFLAKWRMFDNQSPSDYAILNFENEKIRNKESSLNSKKIWFNDEKDSSVGCINPNFLAIEKVARILGIDKSIYKKVLSNFRGVEHRMEHVRTVHGVDYINDSKSTTAEAGRWALMQLKQPIHMICGGRDKNIDFSELSSLVREKVKRMYVIGEAKEKMRTAFHGMIQIQECDLLEDAVRMAQEHSSEGECVLLSPMCTSFDMFNNFEERGLRYKSIVNEL